MDSHYTTPSSDVFFQRGDPDDRRLGEIVGRSKPQVPSTALLGYPDDEGIRRNGGRAGAALAPHAIRRVLYKMTPASSSLAFWDHGDLNLNQPIEKRHQVAANEAKQLLNAGHRILSFGGGHDYGFSDGWALIKYCEEKKVRPLVINFDAHLDVRPLDRGITSGTPFYRLLNEFKNFDFVEFGIQPQCNSLTHIKWAKDRGVRILTLDDYMASEKSMLTFVKEQLADLLTNQRPSFLSIDIDAFSWPYAIGASQSWPLGIDPQQFFPVLDYLLTQLDVRSLGIYEVSPPLEIDNGTSKLAALIAHRFLHV